MRIINKAELKKKLHEVLTNYEYIDEDGCIWSVDERTIKFLEVTKESDKLKDQYRGESVKT